jgi:uncharacterized membrane protein YkoI
MINIRKALVGGGIAAAAVVGGAIGANMFGSAQAATTNTTASTAASTAAASVAAPTESSAPTGTAPDPTQGGHVGANGTKEVLLTGDTATKAKAAALAAVPGGTIERVENDAEGATYEAHMVKADGTHVTVKMDANFAVTSIETGR